MLETENMDNRLFLELKSRIIKRALDKVHIPFERATKFCEIFTLLLSYVVPVKSKVKVLQNFVAISEYLNFKRQLNPLCLTLQRCKTVLPCPFYAGFLD